MRQTGKAAKLVEGKGLSDLRNVGRATLADFRLLRIETVSQLASCDPDDLYRDIQQVTGHKHDPCVRDTFAATIHEARTGEALNWWAFTPERKARKSEDR